ncbi:MAG: hypothetical protein AAGB12_09520 [Pseudomonadota bacterium]
MMTDFPFYQTAWLFYLAAGLLLMLVVWALFRKTNFWLKALLLTIVAACTFTPIQLQNEAETWAPALVVAVFELEQSLNESDSTEGVWRGVTPVIRIWVGLALLSILARLTYTRWIAGINKPFETEARNEEI